MTMQRYRCAVGSRHTSLQVSLTWGKTDGIAWHSTKCNTTQHSVQPSAAQHAAQPSPAQLSTAQHSTAQHSTAQHSAAQRSTAQHSAAHCQPAGCKSSPLPSLSISSMRTMGLLVPVDLRHCTILPGMAPTYVRLCPAHTRRHLPRQSHVRCNKLLILASECCSDLPIK